MHSHPAHVERWVPHLVALAFLLAAAGLAVLVFVRVFAPALHALLQALS